MITQAELEKNGFISIYDALYETGVTGEGIELIKGRVIVGMADGKKYFDVLNNTDGERESVSSIKDLKELLEFCDNVN